MSRAVTRPSPWRRRYNRHRRHLARDSGCAPYEDHPRQRHAAAFTGAQRSLVTRSCRGLECGREERCMTRRTVFALVAALAVAGPFGLVVSGQNYSTAPPLVLTAFGGKPAPAFKTPMTPGVSPTFRGPGRATIPTASRWRAAAAVAAPIRRPRRHPCIAATPSRPSGKSRSPRPHDAAKPASARSVLISVAARFRRRR